MGRHSWALVHHSPGSRALSASQGWSVERSGPSAAHCPHELPGPPEKFMTKFRVANWPEYERSLVQRGDITFTMSPEAVASWQPICRDKHGGQRKSSDLAIETALTLRLVFHLPLQQTEGCLTSVFEMMGMDLDVENYTRLSRRMTRRRRVAQRSSCHQRRRHLSAGDDRDPLIVTEPSGGSSRPGDSREAGVRRQPAGARRESVLPVQDDLRRKPARSQ